MAQSNASGAVIDTITSNAITSDAVTIEGLSAVTLATRDMRRSVDFYCALGFEIRHGDAQAAFTTLACGPSFLNIIAETHGPVNWWGRLIIHVSDVDAMYRKARDAGLLPSRVPSDAPWGERYFHISDPDGHELSFARLLSANESGTGSTTPATTPTTAGTTRA
jgi:catechol 2,3-dioxygenase-like lactoylglutathione lyase family enzyme